MTRRLALSLLVLVTACKTSSPTSGVRDVDGPPSSSSSSLIMALNGAGAEMVKAPVLKPSEVFTKIAAADPEAPRKLVDGMLHEVLGSHAADAARQVLVSSFGPAVLGNDLGDGALTDEILTDATTHLLAMAQADPTVLDGFPTLPLELVPVAQEGLYSQVKEDPSVTGTVKPYPIAPDSPVAVTLKTDGCQAPDPWALAPVAPSIYIGSAMIADAAVGCFHDNGTQLALALNVLANQGGSVALTMPGSSAPVTVTDYRSLLTKLGDAGYTFELFTTRVLVEFEAFVYKDGSGNSSVRMITWTSAKMGDRTVRIPAEHGEAGMAVFKDGRRLAQVRWYGGLPDATHPGMAGFWRAHHELSSPWVFPVHEAPPEVYAPGTSLDRALPWFQAASDVMAGLQTLMARYQPPYDAYGLFVCTDSLAFLMERLGELRGDQTVRHTHAYPLIRKQDVLAKPGLVLDAFVAQHGGFSIDGLNRVYPADPVLVKDAAAFRQRVLEAFPKDADGRLTYFQEFQSTLNQLRNPS